METQSIGFTLAKPHDGIGRVNEGSEIPAMRPLTSMKGMSYRSITKMLDDALELLADSTCSFWACAGPKRPKNMCTCSKCWAMREIAKAKATLELRDDLGL